MPFRRLMTLVSSVLLVMGVVGMTACEATPNPYVHVSGSTLVGPNNAPIHLRGVALGTDLLQEPWLMGGPENSNGMTIVLNRFSSVIGQSATNQFQSNYENQFITQPDIQQIAADGFNVVRLPFNARYLTEQLPVIDNIVSWAQQAGIYVVLDMHAAPCSQNPYFTSDSTDGTAGLWYGPGAVSCKQQTVQAWQRIATRYANSATVAAYDLLNEPDGLAMTNSALTGLYSQIITAIRGVDPNHVVMVEGRNYTKDNSPFTAPLDSNLILSFHQYASSQSNQAQNISQVEAAASKLGGVPVWVGEFGLDLPANVAPQIARFNADSRIVGWSYWPWKMAARSDNQDGLNEYPAPDTWTPVINYMANKMGSTKPTVAQTNQGINDFLNAIKNTTPNTAMLATLEQGE